MKNWLRFITLLFKCFFESLPLFFYRPQDDVGKELKKIFKKSYKIYFWFTVCFILLFATPQCSSLVDCCKLFIESAHFSEKCSMGIYVFSETILDIFKIALPILLTTGICKLMQKIIDSSKSSFSISHSTTDKGKLLVSINDGLEKLIGLSKVIKSHRKKKPVSEPIAIMRKEPPMDFLDTK